MKVESQSSGASTAQAHGSAHVSKRRAETAPDNNRRSDIGDARQSAGSTHRSGPDGHSERRSVLESARKDPQLWKTGLAASGEDYRSVIGGMLDGVQTDIDTLFRQLKSAKPEDRWEIQSKIQEKMEERSEMRAFLTKILQQEHESRMAVINALPSGR